MILTQERALQNEPTVSRDPPFFCRVEGLFYRAINARDAAHAIGGSRAAGRYSSASQPTLYLSATKAGVEAAMIAHKTDRDMDLLRIQISVRAEAIFDLRDETARAALGCDLGDALAPWQAQVANGEEPKSWIVRQTIEAAGGAGLIDPSRKAPGLWHLVLFRWNIPGAP